MIWLTWRQFRAQAIVAAIVLAAAVIALTINGITLSHLYADSGAASCPATGDCAALSDFLSQARHGGTGALFLLGSALLYLVPPVIGVFWGAPLVARELEAGTHRLAWNQSVTRDRWLGAKLAVLGAAAMVFAGLLSLTVWLSSARLDRSGFSHVEPLLFGARGIVPIGYAAFAFVLGVAFGILIRRTVPAMASTLVVYAAAAGAMVLWGRAHLVPAKRLTVPVNLDHLESFGTSENGAKVHLIVNADLPGAWVLRNDTVTTSGRLFDGPADTQACNRDSSTKTCFGWIQSLGLQQRLVCHSPGQFWAMQWAETGIFLGLAGLLAAFGFWWLRRRPA
jgi:ABC-type transport system involved in multi-copper enzyme maturation permease subunit